MDVGAIGVAVGMNREQMKKMSEADKEMELRANRAKALLAERHIGLKTNQVREWLSSRWYGPLYPARTQKRTHPYAHPAMYVL
jgi:hypothetical protein